MRLLVRGLVLTSLASPAFAGDIDNSWLRGSSQPTADPPSYQRWSGLYGGGQAGADFHGIDFSNAPAVSTASISGQDANFTGIPLTNFAPLSVLNTKGPSFGGFIGYNYQIDDVVAGFEFNFNSSAAQASSSNSASRNYYVCAGSPGSVSCSSPAVLESTNFTVTNSAAATITDYGTVRARAGWAYGNFLPYVFGGLSVSQIDSSRAVNVTYSSNCSKASLTCIPIGDTPNGITEAAISHGKWVFGFDTGLGIDYALTKHIFVRGEVEYLQFSSVNDIKLNTTSARVGAGLKF